MLYDEVWLVFPQRSTAYAHRPFNAKHALKDGSSCRLLDPGSHHRRGSLSAVLAYESEPLRSGHLHIEWIIVLVEDWTGIFMAIAKKMRRPACVKLLKMKRIRVRSLKWIVVERRVCCWDSTYHLNCERCSDGDYRATCHSVSIL